MHEIAVSIVVPTHRRAEQAHRLLAALDGQVPVRDDWEVVLVENGAVTLEESGVDLQASHPGYPLRVVRESRPGACHARNLGIESTTGKIVAFLDDDVVPAHDWLETLRAPIESDAFDAVGGRVELDKSVPLPAWIGEHVGYLSQHDLGDQHKPLTTNDYLLTANAAFRREVLVAVGGFDTRLGPSGRAHITNDDIDLCLRAMENGFRVGYTPESVVVHDVPRSRLKLNWLLRRVYQQGRSDWLMDADNLSSRSDRGTAEVVENLKELWRYRRKTGLRSKPVAVAAACDIARTLGFIREAGPMALRHRSST